MRVFKATYKDRKGIVRESKNWYVEIRDHEGRARRLPAFVDKKSSEEFSHKCERLASCRAAKLQPDATLTRWIEELDRSARERLARIGLLDRERLAAGKALTDHLEDFERALGAKGGTTKHAEKTHARAKNLLVERCSFRWWGDIEAARVLTQLDDMRKDRLGDDGKTVVPGIRKQTCNYYLSAVKQFCRWMVRERRVTDSPLTHLQPLNARTDRRRDRRALTTDECRRLLAQTEASAEMSYGMGGPDRAALYRLALETGLRWNELRSLKRDNLDLDEDRPTITVKAAYSKHRREDVLPLRPNTAHFMGDYLANRLPAAVAFPMPATDQGAKMLRADLKATRIAWIKAAKGDIPEVKRRVKDDFLKDTDDAGRVLDFHGLRHTFATRLMEAGVHPKVIQALMRHSTITLTMDRYTHLTVANQTAALDVLPDLDSAEGDALRATGTDDLVLASCLASEGSKRAISGNVGQHGSERGGQLIDDEQGAETLETAGVGASSREWAQLDSNQRPRDYESPALTN